MLGVFVKEAKGLGLQLNHSTAMKNEIFTYSLEMPCISPLKPCNSSQKQFQVKKTMQRGTRIPFASLSSMDVKEPLLLCGDYSSSSTTASGSTN